MNAGINTIASLRCLRPVLQKWIDLNTMLGVSWSKYGDAPWWYNERALISVLAGAIWQCGGYAFEEYSEEKRGKKHPFSGRIDLAFSAGRHEFRAEAKQCWPAVTARRDQTKYISGFMEKAKNDVRRCKPDGTRRLAIVFGPPYMAKRLHADIDSRIEWIVAQAMKIGADATAWVFPTLRRYPTIRGWAHPGIIVWITEVRR